MKDEETLESLEVDNGGKLYYKDLGMYGIMVWLSRSLSLRVVNQPPKYHKHLTNRLHRNSVFQLSLQPDILALKSFSLAHTSGHN